MKNKYFITLLYQCNIGSLKDVKYTVRKNISTDIHILEEITTKQSEIDKEKKIRLVLLLKEVPLKFLGSNEYFD